MEVESGVTSGDYLHGFYLGTRAALFEKGRQSVTLTLKSISEYAVGVLIALLERTVGLYAHLVNVNAYHQPGVEAGKKAAGEVLKLQATVVGALRSGKMTARQIADRVGSDDVETVFHICEHLAANDRVRKFDGGNPFEALYALA